MHKSGMNRQAAVSFAKKRLFSFRLPKKCVNSAVFATKRAKSGLSFPQRWRMMNLTTCANQEDYVNMGYNAAKKAYDSMHLAKYILAAKLICDSQALDCYDDKRCAKGTQAIYDLLRSKVPEMDNDMPLTPYLEAVAQQIIDRAYIRTVEVSVGALKF